MVDTILFWVCESLAAAFMHTFMGHFWFLILLESSDAVRICSSYCVKYRVNYNVDFQYEEASSNPVSRGLRNLQRC